MPRGPAPFGLALAVFVALLTAASSMTASAQARLDGLPRFKAIDAPAQTKDLGRGINILGHERSFETGQGMHFKEVYFRRIAAAGFRTVRVPQYLLDHSDAEGRFDPLWLAKMDWVVRLATRNGLNVVIDNNGGCSREGAACLERTARAWGSLARHYRQAPNTVLFELYNEPDGAITPDLWNAGVAKILAAIRTSNPTRNLIVGTAHAYNLRDLAALQLPTGDRHIIATFHYYEPYAFTHQGGAWLPPDRRPPLGARFGTPAEVTELSRNFDYVAAWSAWYHRPIFLGEFGALEAADLGDRVLWTTLVARAAEQRGFAWAYWQFDGDFTAYDDAREAWVEPVLRALMP